MKAAFEENGVECQFMRAADGKTKCVYPAENAEQVAVIKADYKQMHSEIAENLTVQKDENGITITDEQLGKSFSFSSVNKAQTMQVLQELPFYVRHIPCIISLQKRKEKRLLPRY